MFGRQPRYKSAEQVGRELDALRAAGATNVFFVDDNMIGNRAAAKDLLRFLAEYQRRNGHPLSFGTEVSINLAQDRELLELFREARFGWVFIGIESSDPETLKQARKTQNMREDTLTAIRRIYSYGIDVLAGFIVGFDSDTLETFDHQHRFIVQSGVQAAMVGLLTALPRTPLYERLQKEGRLRPLEGNDNTKPATNVVPKRMSYEVMVQAYERMYRRLTRDGAIAARVRNKLRYMPFPLYHGEYPPRERISILTRLFLRGIVPGGPVRWWHFARSLPLRSPRRLPLAVMDWIAGLSMRDYVDRHFGVRRGEEKLLNKLSAAIARAAAQAGDARVVLGLRATVPNLSIHFGDGLPGPFIERAARHLERLLARTRVTLTLRIEALREQELPSLERLLERLRRYGDRVSIVVDRELRKKLSIDSSVFHLVLE
jgi:hypothetical protein